MQRNPDHIRQPQKQQAFTASYSGTLMKVERKTSASISEDERNHTMRGEVEMTRDTRTHDVAMSFIDLYRNRKWEVNFSVNFPHDGVSVTSKS